MKAKISTIRRVVRQELHELVHGSSYGAPQTATTGTQGQKAAILNALPQITATAAAVVQYFADYKKFAQGQKSALQKQLQQHQQNLKAWERVVAAAAPGHEASLRQIAKGLSNLGSMMNVPFGGMFKSTGGKAQQTVQAITRVVGELQKALQTVQQ